MDSAIDPPETKPPSSTISCPDGRDSMILADPQPGGGPPALMAQYRAILDAPRLDWTEHHRLLRRLGSGGQGVVYLGERRGADGFRLPVALKVFSPERYADAAAYDEAMARMARVAVRVAQIQQDNLLDVHNFVEHRAASASWRWSGSTATTCGGCSRRRCSGGRASGSTTSAGPTSTT